MKQVLSLLLLVSLEATAQPASPRINFGPLPDSTAIGVADGTRVQKEIGPEGGMIASDDGRVELIFPAGALTTTATISIQPTTNPTPNGMGKAYQFEPTGTQFKKPVNLIFHYTTEEAETCPADLMGFAMQDHTGKWSSIDYESRDTIHKTLIGHIRHFSGYASRYLVYLIPRNYELRMGDTMAVHLGIAIPGAIVPPSAPADSTHVATWYVNNVPNGGAGYGSIYDATPTSWRAIYASYIAPDLLPDKNPVTIKVIVLVPEGKGVSVRTFSTKLKLYDEYKILVTDTIEARVGMGVFVADSSSFIARVTLTNINVVEVKNYPPYSFIKHKAPIGSLDIFIKNDCMGQVHIGRSRSNGNLLSYSQAFFIETNLPRKVLINFDSGRNLAFRYLLHYPGVKLPIEEMPFESIPSLVSFYVNGKPQTYRIDSREGKPYTIYVQRTAGDTFHFPRW